MRFKYHKNTIKTYTGMNTGLTPDKKALKNMAITIPITHKK
jgi:hypothetical protein